MAKVTGKTKTGFAFSYDDRMLSDWRYATALARSQNGTDTEKLVAMVQLVELLIGKDEMVKLQEHVCELNDGFAPDDKIIAEWNDMLEANKNAKN